MLDFVGVDRFGKLFRWSRMVLVRVPELATFVRTDVVGTLTPIREWSCWHIRVVSKHCVELRHLAILVKTRPPAHEGTDATQVTEG